MLTWPLPCVDGVSGDAPDDAQSHDMDGDMLLF